MCEFDRTDHILATAAIVMRAIPCRRCYPVARMFPYLEPPVPRLGWLEFHPWLVLFVTGILVAYTLALGRARKLGMKPAGTAALAFWIVASGIIGAHLFSAVYGRSIAGGSSFGGLLGGILGGGVFLPPGGSPPPRPLAGAG